MTTEIELDVLIIGSGAGGGTVADQLSHLCEQGARIAIAEAGPWFTREHFNMRETDMLGLFVDRGAVPSDNFEIAVTAASCVGGSTSVYTGVTFRAPEGLVDEWSRDYGLSDLSEQDIQARFPIIEEQINAHFPGRDYENENNRVFRHGCDALGWPLKEFRVNIDDCERCGFCNLGCPYAAKRGTLEVQVPRAIERGVELIPNCRITRLHDDGAEGVIGEAPDGTRASDRGTGAVRFRAKTVVLAAGTLGSSALLQRSQLPDLGSAVGRYITLHPALTSFARMEQSVRGFDGFPKLYYTDQFSESHHYYIETAFYFPFMTAKSLPGFGSELKRFMASYGNLSCALTLVHDEAERDNRIEVEGEGIRVHYRLSEQTRAALVHAQRSAGELYFAAGAKEYVSLISKRFSVTDASELHDNIDDSELMSGKVVVSSAHPMGGCRMGCDPATSVTDSWGRVHAHPSIVVADASLFPTSTKVNPYLTIMAFAQRAAEGIEQRLG